MRIGRLLAIIGGILALGDGVLALFTGREDLRLWKSVTPFAVGKKVADLLLLQPEWLIRLGGGLQAFLAFAALRSLQDDD